MRLGPLRFVLLAAAVASASSSAGTLSQAAPGVHIAQAVRGSILVATARGIYRRYPSGSLKQLTNTVQPPPYGQIFVADLYPAWSRSGTRIAFERLNDAFENESCPLLVMNSDGSDLHQVGQVTTDCSGASWGPNDNRLVFGGGPPGANGATLWVVNADGTGLRRLLRGDGSNGEGTHPSWSPDGRTIVFGWSAGPAVGLLSIRPDGTRLRALVKRRPAHVAEFYEQPTWSHDGKRLAFVRVAFLAQTRTIMVAPASGLRPHAIARLPLNPGGVGGLSWSPSGSLLAFSGVCGEQACVWTIPSRGGIRRVLMRGGFVQPGWGPAGT